MTTIVSRLRVLSAPSLAGLAGGILGVILCFIYVALGVLNVGVGFPGAPPIPQIDFILAGLVELAFAASVLSGPSSRIRKSAARSW